MAEYVSPPIAVDADELKAQVFDELRARFPGWEPADGNLDVWMIEAFCEVAAQIGESVTFVLRAIFRYFGSLVGVNPIDATAAETTVTVTFVDTAGHTIDEGTAIAWDSGGELVGFQFADDVTVAPGSSSVTGARVVAITPGAIGSGLSGAAQLLDPLDFIATVTAETPTTGGTDGEDDDTFVNRLADELRLLSPRPILPDDFATLAKRQPGVARATAVNGLNPDTGTTGNERYVAVYVVDDAGQPVPASVRTALATTLEGYREVNFVVKVADPVYTTVNVTYSATVYPGWVAADVKANADAALASYLSPSTWGQPAYGDQRAWLNRTTVRYLEVASVLNGVEGLDEVTALTLNGVAGDVTMTGPVSLPTVGTITGTVS